MANGKTASQVGAWGGYGASLAVDGDIGPDLDGGSCSHPDDVNKEAAWWSVDLGDVYQITDIVFFARNGYYGRY